MQVAPVQPGAHVHVKELTPSVQVPPFWQGFGEQLLISGKKVFLIHQKHTVLEQNDYLYSKIQSLAFCKCMQTYLFLNL